MTAPAARAELDATGGHLRPGESSTTASWLRDEQQLTDGAARASVRLATTLRDDLPGLAELLLAGEVTVEHAAAVRDGVRGLDGDIVREADAALCALAVSTDPADIRVRLRDKAAAIDDRVAADAERRARERMGVRLSDIAADTAIDGTIPNDDGGARLRLAMDLALEAEREAGNTRSKAARRAGILVSWADEHLRRHHRPGDSTADDAHTVRPRLTVLCWADQLPAAEQPGQAGREAQQHADLTALLAAERVGAPPAAPTIVGEAPRCPAERCGGWLHPRPGRARARRPD